MCTTALSCWRCQLEAAKRLPATSDLKIPISCSKPWTAPACCIAIPSLVHAVASLLHVEPAETTLGGVLHQSLMQVNALTHRPQVFQWNPDAESGC